MVQCQRPTGSISESRKPPHSSPFHSMPHRRTGKTRVPVLNTVMILHLKIHSGLSLSKQCICVVFVDSFNT